MKKLVNVMLIVVLLSAPCVVFAANDTLTVSHSASFGCGACHDAHNRDTVAQAAGVPLWGTFVSPGTGLLAYTTASSRAGYTGGAVPDGSSLLCLACHDGATNSGTNPGHVDAGNAVIDTATMHAISFDYTARATAINALNAASFTVAPSSTYVVLDANDKLQCTSCHEIHGSNTFIGKALRGDDATGAAICSACHLK